MHNFLFLVLSLLIVANGSAQSLPASQIYSFSLKGDPEKGFSLQNGTYLTSFNADGYNDQPYLSPDGKLYYSIRMQGDTQNDIYVLELEKGERYKFTATEESEYSPRPLNYSEELLCVRVDEKSSPKQQLWSYPMNRQDQGRLKWITDHNVGYFAMVSDSTAAVFTLSEKNDLRLVNFNSGRDVFIAENIGRSLDTDEEGDILFLHKAGDDFQYLKRYDTDSKIARILTRLNYETTDFTFHEGLIWFGEGSLLKVFDPDTGIQIQIADLALHGIQHITRLVVTNEKLILVNQPK